MPIATPPHTGRQAARRADLRFRALHAIAVSPRLSQRDLAREIGVSLGAAHGLLNGLIAAGLVKIGAGGAVPARSGFAYELTAAGRREKAGLAAGYLDRRQGERDRLVKEIEALEAEIGSDPDTGS